MTCMLYLDEPKYLCFAYGCQARGIQIYLLRLLLIPLYVCHFLMTNIFYIFLSPDSSLFHLCQSLPYEVVILGWNFQGKENCQAHMILILNACPIFKHLTFYHFSKDDTSLPLLQPSKTFLLWVYNKTSLCCFIWTNSIYSLSIWLFL